LGFYGSCFWGKIKMVNRYKQDYIGVIINGNVIIKFYFDQRTDERERKVTTAIFSLEGTLQTVADALEQQLHDELNITCRTELVKEIFVDVSRIYYPDRYPKGNDINMEFHTDYLVRKEIREGYLNPIYHGFYCGSTLGRFDRKKRQFREVSNNMIDKCHIM